MPATSTRTITTGPRDQRKRPGDLTGVNSQKLAAERDEAAEAESAARIAEAQSDRVEKLSTVVDVSETPNGRRVEAEVVESPVEVHPQTMLIRVNYPIEQMTFGREVISQPVIGEHGEVLQPAVLGGMQTYDFEEGQQYRVPWELGAHLKDRGYVYDF
jgi:hypothetical protein